MMMMTAMMICAAMRIWPALRSARTSLGPSHTLRSSPHVRSLNTPFSLRTRCLSSKAGDNSTNKPGGQKGEGGAPFRHPLAWNKEEFYDEKALDVEMRRVFDVCHGCRRCFNLCNSFPKLFELIDQSPTGEMDSVPSSAFKSVVDDCTLCDLCFLSKCPYTPPHGLNIDFPHLMLRYRAVEQSKHNKEGALKLNPVPPGEDSIKMGPSAGGMSMEGHGDPARTKEGVERKLSLNSPSFVDKQLTNTDRNGRAFGAVSSVVNWATDTGNQPVRNIIESLVGIHKSAVLPKFASGSGTFEALAKKRKGGHGGGGNAVSERKVVLYSTCLVNYNMPAIGQAAMDVLEHNGVDVVTAYPQCCGMPQLENGDVAEVAKRAIQVSKELLRYVDEGRTVVSLTPSCSLMLKCEWPLILPNNSDVERLSKNTMDICEYVVSIGSGISKDGLAPIKGIKGVQLQNACHARAQNVGCKSAEMLRIIPGMTVTVVERCSGHGGSWGCKSKTHETAMKVGKPAARALLKLPKTLKEGEACLSSECPLAAQHLMQLVSELKKPDSPDPFAAHVHPIQLLAAAYGLRPLENVQ